MFAGGLSGGDGCVSELMDGLLNSMLVTKPNDTRRSSADRFSGTLEPRKRLVLIASDVGNVDNLKAGVKHVGDMGTELVIAEWNLEGEPAARTTAVQDLVKAHGTFKTDAMVCDGYDRLCQGRQNNAIVLRRGNRR